MISRKADDVIMMYRELYSEDFLTLFGGYKVAFSNLELPDGSFAIDVDEVYRLCGSPKSVSFGNCESKIILDEFNAECKRRFQLSCEIGHFLLKHEELFADLKGIFEHEDTLRRMNEIAANRFAMGFLLPDKLFKVALQSAFKDLSFLFADMLDNEDVEKLIDLISEKVVVSTQIVKLKAKEIGVFRNANINEK